MALRLSARCGILLCLGSVDGMRQKASAKTNLITSLSISAPGSETIPKALDTVQATTDKDAGKGGDSVATFKHGAKPPMDQARASGGKGASKTHKLIADIPVLNYPDADTVQNDQQQEWVLMAQAGTDQAQLQEMCNANQQSCNLVGHTQGVPFLGLRGSELELEAVLRRAAPGMVRYVELDQGVYAIPEVDQYDGGMAGPASTWGLHRIGLDRHEGGAGASVYIFVFDTGVRTSHSEFTGRASSYLDLSSGDAVWCFEDQRCAQDFDGHGTHCAGSAAGATYGVASLAMVKSVKVLDDQGRGSLSWSVFALDELAANTHLRPAVASMSLAAEGELQALTDAVDAAVSAGVTVVVAAGNNQRDARFYTPANIPSAITVSAVGRSDSSPLWTNYGDCVDIAAPGVDIVSLGHLDDTGTAMLSGTSMACPHVSGAAALLLGADPSKNSSAVLAELHRTMDRNTGKRMWISSYQVEVLYLGAGGAPVGPRRDYEIGCRWQWTMCDGDEGWPTPCDPYFTMRGDMGYCDCNGNNRLDPNTTERHYDAADCEAGQPDPIIQTLHCFSDCARPLEGAGECIWRQTEGCDPNGNRNPYKDTFCSFWMEHGASGYCDCNGNNAFDANETGYTCDDTPGYCIHICEALNQAPESAAIFGYGHAWLWALLLLGCQFLQ